MYIQQYDGHLIIIFLYVDDLLVTSSTVITSISVIKTALHNAFEMIDLGLLKQFWGLEIEQNFDGIMVNQSKYISDLLFSLKWMNLRLLHSLSFQGSSLKKEKAHLPWTALFIDS